MFIWIMVTCVAALPECPMSAYCDPNVLVAPGLCEAYCNQQGGSRILNACYTNGGVTTYAQSECRCSAGSPNPTCEVPALQICLTPASSYESCKSQCRGGTLQYTFNNGISVCDCLQCKSLSTSSQYPRPTPQTDKPTSRVPTLQPSSEAPTTGVPSQSVSKLSMTSDARLVFTLQLFFFW